MADTVSKEVRSRVMRKIRGRDTKPELAVRSHLHRAGLRYRLHVRDLPGSPDVLLPKYRAAVFVQGCFWHQHPRGDCPHTGVPLSNKAYWEPKLARTRQRDASRQAELQKMGWNVFVAWECEIDEQRLDELVADIRGSRKCDKGT